MELMMKRCYPVNGLIIALVVLMFMLTTACQKKQAVESVKEVRPVKTMVVKTSGLGGVRNFPGRIDANIKADLAFRVSGKVAKFLVKEGDLVKKGEVIAKLDPTDFQITVNDKKALFTRASNDYKRGKKLVKDGNISRMDYDKLEANFLSRKAELNLVKQQLAYTELKAPFSGIIARRYIQNFEEIQAKQNIVTLNDNSILEVKFDLPENLILRIKSMGQVTDIKQLNLRDSVIVMAIFQSHKDKQYPLSFKEISTKANNSTQTFAVTYTMPKPKNMIVLPGMTAMVRVDLRQFMNKEDVFYLPVSAVVANAALQGTVWVVNETTMKVDPIAIKVGIMKGHRIEVKEGIKVGQRIVIAGVPFLYKGLKVSLMKMTEQAKDNIKHSQPVIDEDSVIAGEAL
jgi:RND family efflux transporter MFP subunit